MNSPINPTEDFRTVQNSSEDFSNLKNPSEDFSDVQNDSQRAPGVGRGKKYAGADTPAHELTGQNFIIMEEAYAMFESAGERRSIRMIAEYCKNGELICEYDSDDKRWHIAEESVENKIEKIKALNARKVGLPHDGLGRQGGGAEASSIGGAERAAPRTVGSGHRAKVPGESEELRDKVKRLERELMDSQIANRGKDYFIEQMQNQSRELIEAVQTHSRQIGVLETKLLPVGSAAAARCAKDSERWA